MAKNTNTAVELETEVALETTPETISTVEVVEVDVAELYKELKTKSALIRHLAQMNWNRGRIAKELKAAGILSEKSAYQHVRNVLTQPLKRTEA